MDAEQSLAVIENYIRGWKENDFALILASLTQDCIIIESHGPTYQGVVEVELWFKLWLQANSYVKKWDILAFNFCEQEQTAFVEWNFVCISNKTEYALQGISKIKFTDAKINFIHEYKMTKPAYSWQQDKLQSE